MASLLLFWESDVMDADEEDGVRRQLLTAGKILIIRV